MRTKIISIILCFSIITSPSLAHSYQKTNPDSEFLGNFMVFNFFDSKFNLKNSNKYQKALSDIPEDFRGLTKVWTLIYLSWVFYYLVQKEYGKQFAEQMLDTANQKWIKASELSGENMEVYSYWFPKLESIVRNSMDKTIKGEKVPAEVLVAWAFLVFDSGSPYFQQTDPNIKNMLDFSIAMALAEGKDGAMTFMTKVVALGGPIDGEVGGENQYSNGKDPKLSNSPQISKKDPKEISIEDAQDQVRKRPSDPNAHYILGKSYFLSSQYQEAIISFNEAIRIKPNDANTHYAAGASNARLGNNQESINSFKEAIRIKPNYAPSHEELGIVYSTLGKYQDAITSLKEAIRLKPDSSNAYYNLGMAYKGANQFQEAIFSLKEGLRLQPNYVNGHIELGINYSKLKRHQEAIDSFKKAVRINPNNSLAHNNLGVAYSNLGKRNESLSEYKEAIRIDPKNTLAQKNLKFLEKRIVSEKETLKDKSLKEESIKLKMLQNLKETERLENERALLQKELKEFGALNLPKETKRHKQENSLQNKETTLSGYGKNFQEGLEAFDQKNYLKALHKWKPLAEQGHTNPQINLGLLYQYGYGVTQDFSESAKWYRLAANKGNSVAQSNLGSFYYNGTGVTQDYYESFKWRKLAAEQGEPFSQSALGAMYSMGRGVVRDYIQAHKWFTMAIKNGHEKAHKGLNFVEQKMTSNQILEARSLTKNLANKLYENFEVKGSSFIVSTRKAKDDDWENKQSNFVPLVPENTCYGWVIELSTQLNSVQAKEVFTMPFIPTDLKLPANYSFGRDGKSVIGQWNKKIKDNFIGNSWCVAEDDPSGSHNMDVYIEDKLISSFPFTVGYGEILPAKPQPKSDKEQGNFASNDFEKYGEYFELASSFYSGYMEILSNALNIGQLSESILGEEITSKYANNRKNILSAKIEFQLGSLNKKLSTLTSPDFKLKVFREMVQGFNNYVNTLPNVIRKCVDLHHEMFEAALNQDFELYNDLDFRSRTTMISLLEGENNYLNLQKLNRKSSSPVYKFYEVIQYSNNALISIIKARLSDYYKDTPSDELSFLTSDALAYIRVGNAELEKGKEIINASNLFLNEWTREQKIKLAKFPQFTKSLNLVKNNYVKSFEVENNIANVLQGALTNYPDIEIDKFEILLDEFVNQRLALQQEQANLISKFRFN